MSAAVASAAAAVRRASTSMPTTFRSAAEHVSALTHMCALPAGFRVGTHTFEFRPRELPEKVAKMTLTLLALDTPSPNFAAMFTRNAFPGAPVRVGRARLCESAIQAIIVNNKISNVCAPGGVEDAEAVCAAVATQLGLPSAKYVLPSSTGVIGWKLPVESMLSALPSAVGALQRDSILPAARGIMTTDMYPKVRAVEVPGTGGRIVGIAKGAGMIEPNLATMLVYILTDLAVPRDQLRAMLPRAVDTTFNALSIDSDQSTSDTVVCVASNAVPMPSSASSAFEEALSTVCAQLSEDVVRNGEGVQHVMRVRVSGAPSRELARAVGKSIVNSPLFKCAVAGNDPNVGRLVAAIGKCIGNNPAFVDFTKVPDLSAARIRMGGLEIFSEGKFRLNPDTEKALVKHMKDAQLWESSPAVRTGAAPTRSDTKAAHYLASDVMYHTPVDYPPHERCVEIDVDLGAGDQAFMVLGSDLTHEYVTENADYRS